MLSGLQDQNHPSPSAATSPELLIGLDNEIHTYAFLRFSMFSIIPYLNYFNTRNTEMNRLHTYVRRLSLNVLTTRITRTCVSDSSSGSFLRAARRCSTGTRHLRTSSHLFVSVRSRVAEYIRELQEDVDDVRPQAERRASNSSPLRGVLSVVLSLLVSIFHGEAKRSQTS